MNLFSETALLICCENRSCCPSSRNASATRRDAPRRDGSRRAVGLEPAVSRPGGGRRLGAPSGRRRRADWAARRHPWSRDTNCRPSSAARTVEIEMDNHDSDDDDGDEDWRYMNALNQLWRHGDDRCIIPTAYSISPARHCWSSVTPHRWVCQVRSIVDVYGPHCRLCSLRCEYRRNHGTITGSGFECPMGIFRGSVQNNYDSKFVASKNAFCKLTLSL